MNFFDYILLTIVGIPTILALWMGIVRIAALLIGLVIAFITAAHLSHVAGIQLHNWLPNQTVADTVGFALVFIVVMVMAGLVGSIINKLFDMANISWLDRILGMLAGTASGLLLIALSFLLYTSYAKIEQPWLKESLLTPYAVKLGDTLGKAIPEGYPFSRQGNAAKKAPKLEDLKKAAKDAAKAVKEKIPDSDSIPVSDKEAMKSIIEQQLK